MKPSSVNRTQNIRTDKTLYAPTARRAKMKGKLEGTRMMDESRRMKDESLALQFASSLLHHSSFLLRRSYFIVHPS
jgi:hypothetical protein